MIAVGTIRNAEWAPRTPAPNFESEREYIVKRTLLPSASARWIALGTVGFVLLLWPVLSARAQEKPVAGPPPRGQDLFVENCTGCHARGDAVKKDTPNEEALMNLTPEVALAALTTGTMAAQAQNLNAAEKRAIAVYLGGRPLGVTEVGNAKDMSNLCTTNPPLGDPSASPEWNGWGNDLMNTRFQPTKEAGLSASQVPQLKLKWAFGFPRSARPSGQPTIASGRVFVGVDTGFVYSVNADTGCVYWSYQAQTRVRTAISIGSVRGQGSATLAAYFGDERANVYAVNAATGELLWKVPTETNPLAHMTGAPTLYAGRLYVPIAAAEETVSENSHYQCCTFRGSVVALDANTGKQVWKSYTIPEAPKPTRKNSSGTQQWGPAGAAVWSAPTIDVQRHALYAGTSDAYTEPAAKTSDSIVAFDLDTGKMLWAFQNNKSDVWMHSCDVDNPPDNCPRHLGPDGDYGSSPILRTLGNGRPILVAGAKSGDVVGLDPTRKGALVWKTDLAEKAPGDNGLIVFGGAADEQAAYFPLNGVSDVVALNLGTGERKWVAHFTSPLVPGHSTYIGSAAAVTAIPGIVFSGGWDGILRAFSSEDGHKVWEYDTARDYMGVNGVAAKGGSMGAPGPTVANGMVFVVSGYVGGGHGTPGNVMLAFSPK